MDTDAALGDPFWLESARDLIKAICLFVVSSAHFAPEERNLITVRRLILEGAADLRDMILDDGADKLSAYDVLFLAMSRNKAFSDEVAIAGERFGRMAKGGPKMLESISAVAASNMDFLASDEMRACLTHSSFCLDELKTDPKGVSLYLCLPQRFMNTHFRFLRMMVTLILTQMEACSRQPACGHPILMLLDEFAGLKKLPIIETSSAQIAGYGVKLMFIVQSIAQLKTTCRENWETLLANCGIKMFFGNDDHCTREHVTKLIGECEVVRRTATLSQTQGVSNTHSIGGSIGHTDGTSISDTRGMSYSGTGVQFSVSHADSQSKSMTLSVNENQSSAANQSSTLGTHQSVHKRPLITPDEVGRIFGNREARRALVLLSGLQPLQLKRVQYYNEIGLAGRFDPHPDHPAPPTKAQLQARDAAILRQAQIKRQTERQQKQAKEWALSEDTRRKNERYFEERYRERQRKLQAHQAQASAVNTEHDRMKFSALLWCVGIVGV